MLPSQCESNFEKAVAHFQNGDTSTATHFLERALKDARREANIRVVAGCLGLLGDIQKSVGNMTAAEDSYQNALCILDTDSSLPPYFRSMPLFSLGELAYARNDTGEARQFYEETLACIGDAVGMPQYGLVLERLGELYFKAKRFAEAFRIVERMLWLHRQTHNVPREAEAKHKLGLCKRSLEQYDSAIKEFQKAEELAWSCGQTEQAIISHAEQGFTYGIQEKHVQAVEVFQQVLEFRRRHRYFDREEVDRSGLVHSLAQLGRTEEVMVITDRCLQKGKSLTSQELTARFTSRIRLGQAIEVLPELNEELAKARRTADKLWEANVLGNIGLAYRVLDKQDEARQSFEGALQLHRQIGDAEGEHADLGNLQGLVDDIKKTNESHDLTDEALISAHHWEESLNFLPDSDARLRKYSHKPSNTATHS